jgi:predicted membrane protein
MLIAIFRVSLDIQGVALVHSLPPYTLQSCKSFIWQYGEQHVFFTLLLATKLFFGGVFYLIYLFNAMMHSIIIIIIISLLMKYSLYYFRPKKKKSIRLLSLAHKIWIFYLNPLMKTLQKRHMHPFSALFSRAFPKKG